MRPGSLAGIPVLSVAILIGCGAGEEEKTTPAPPPPGPRVAGKLMPPPQPRESINEAVSRITGVFASDDCATVNRLTPLSRQHDACEGLQGFANLPVSASAAYGNGGGVISIGEGETLRNVILILDSDGLFHIPVVDPFTVSASANTKFGSGFDAAATEAVHALRERDCDAFKAVALVRFGPGGTPDQICTYVNRSPLGQLLATYGEARPKKLGGDSTYAFYGVSTPEAHYTMVMARETDTGVAQGTPALPDNAPEYGFVDAYQTNPTTVTPPPAG